VPPSAPTTGSGNSGSMRMVSGSSGSVA
jgi:hypothetical protein